MKRSTSALVLALLVCVTGCTKVGTGVSDASGGRHPYTHPHELRYGVAADIEHLNPLESASLYEMYLAQMCMAYLVRTDANGDATVPELVTKIPSQANGDISKDGKTITYRLRHGVKWSDGVPFTADDVVFTTKQILNPANNVESLDGWDLIEKIDEPDKYTVTYHLKKPYSSFSETFFSTAGANPAVLPEHLLKGLHDLNTTSYNSLPVGIGPFKYVAWRRGDAVVMERDPNYFRGVPKLERVVFKIISDKNTMLEQLRTHELDLWLKMTPHYFVQAKQIEGVSTIESPAYAFDHLDFNLTHPLLADVRVRQALRYAVDRSELVAKVQNNIFTLDESPVTTASAFHLDVPNVAFDLARARTLLDAAGWTTGSDGVRVRAGQRLSLTYVLSTGQPDYDTEAELIRGWWKQIGVELTIKHYLASQLFATAANGGVIFGGKFDVVRFGWTLSPNEDLSNLYACYRFPPDGQNDMHWCDPAATAAMDRAKTSYDRSARARDIADVQRRLFPAAPTIVLDERKELAAYNSDLKNWHPNALSPFDDMMSVDI